jgi:diguanylate cyclase (GGDEF)-like protein
VVIVASLVLAATCAALAAAAWAAQARHPRSFRRVDAAALAVWGALSAAGHLVGLGAPALAGLRIGLVAVAAVLALGAVAGATRTVLARGGFGPALAEGVLVGASAVCIAWVVSGAPADPPPARIAAVVLCVVDVSAIALILRMPVLGRGAGVRPGYRARLLVAAGAVAAVGVCDLLAALLAAPPQALVNLATAAGYLTAAVVPYVGESPRPVLRRSTFSRRLLPYGLVALAVLAVGLQAAFGRVGAVAVLLVVVDAACLVAVQAFALRENSGLLADLELSRQRLEALVENAQDVIIGLDVGGRVVAANAAVARLLARPPSLFEGRDVAEVAVLDDRPAVREAVRDVVAGRRATAKVELRLAHPAQGMAEMRLRGVDGGAVAVLSDVTDAVLLREQLEILARHDRMTGLVNRGVVLDTVSSWLAEGAPVSLLYCDLDGYKAVNDRFGHLAGDEVLVEVARRLETAVRGMPAPEALLGRIGGDEFVVALRGVSGGDALAAGERLVAALRPTFRVRDRTVRVGISVGVCGTDDAEPLPQLSVATGEGSAAAELLHRGDLAMFTAKAAGRAKVARWDSGVQERALRRVDIAIGLRQALDTGRLALAYQPLVRLSDGVVTGVEALIRIEGGDGNDAPGALSGMSGFVSPAELVEVAEDTGEITEMGQWVLRQATHRASLWRKLGHDLFVGVNMSVRQMSADGFVESVRRALADSELEAAELFIEITEGQLVGEEDPVRGVIEELRRDGVQFVIDDFGTGYSSLSYLKTMPVRGIKLDRTLLDGIGTDPRATTLARSVVGVARALGLAVVAEGLESLEAARLVRDLGAWAGQGFALHPPLREDELLDVLSGAPLDLSGDGAHRVIDVTDGATAALAGAGGSEPGRRSPVASSVTSPGSPPVRAAGAGVAANGSMGVAPRPTGGGNGVAGVVLPTYLVSDDETTSGVD